ncbi:hypothetical protein EC957_003485 [Mortierella hygrophila]|uniref:PXA domain-containing protein n=1 Tax=Mortierella hygrophila TaxID=979708 RepID=A0A9P6FFT1_9FUNG|nr:hypothetical protein EC957_003485 [Mortierella hygrophila]
MEIAQPLPTSSSSFTNDDDDIITPFTTTTHAQVSPASVESFPLLAPHHATLESNTTITNSSNMDSDDPSQGSTATTTTITSAALPHTTSPNNDLTTIRTPTPALSENKNNSTIDASSSSEPSSSPTKKESSPSILATAAAIPSPLPADTQTVPDSDRAHTISKDTPYATLEHILAQLKEQPERAITIASVVGGLIVVRYILPRIGWATFFVGVLGMGFGGFIVAFYLLAVPEATRLKRASSVAKFGRHHDQRFEIVDGVPSWSESHEKLLTITPLPEAKDSDLQHVNISPDIDPMVEDMITYALRDFVNVPVGLVSEGQHNVPLRASMVAMAMNLTSRFSNVRLPETALLAVFGLQNNFIVHLRAYRELRASRLPIETYVAAHANPDSVIGRCYHKEERQKQLRSTAKAICQALLSKGDQQSKALFAVMQEIMASHVLESTLDYVCDPDFINLSIIDYFSTSAAEQKDGAAASEAARSATRETKLEEAPISSLADSILMNAAHLMDKTSRDPQESGPAIHKPTPQHTIPLLDTSVATRSLEAPRSAQVSTPRSGSITQGKHFIVQPKPYVSLKDVLSHKNEHIDIYQEFIAYIQVWDAMDLVQFWVMIDIFHRQIEQGTFANPEDLRREANNIFESYCGQDPEQQVTGIRDAKGGAVLKNLRKNIRPNPAYCFAEPQEWAMSVLDQQYWEPFKSKQEREAAAVETPQRSASESPEQQQPQQLVDDAAPRPSMASMRSSSSLSLAASPIDLESVVERTTPTQQPPSVPKLSVQAINLTDMVNRRPKTLMSNSDLSYMVEVQTHAGQGWMVTRTFQQLEQLQQALLQQYPVVQRSIFPRWRLQPSDKVCLGLQNFMRAMLAIPEVSESMSLSWFLSKDFDQCSVSVQEAGLFRNSMPSTSNPLAESGKAIGLAASQGAKTALRQASEASLSAGRFFKSIGAAVTNGTSASSPQLTPMSEEKSARGSFDSVRSSSSTFTLPERQQHNAGQPMTPGSTPVPTGSHSTPMSGMEGPRSDTPSRFSSSLRDEATQSPIATNLPAQEISALTSPVLTAAARKSDASGFESSPHTSFGSLPGSSNTQDSLPGQGQSIPTPVSLPESTPTIAPTPSTSPSVAAPTATSAPTAGSPPLPKKKMALLSNDELDLLIETSFTVLEDIMDFSKGQSIRRMTFGVLRELVRKSYRVAINQSFSTWVEQSTSHESTVEMVRWMKEDLLWPNGEWPVVPPAPVAAAVAAGNEDTAEKDIIRVGDDSYEIGSDGIAVKVQPSNNNNASSKTTDTTTPTTTVPVPAERTEKEKEVTREKARELVKIMLPGSLVTVLGKEAVLRGLVDVFEMMQIKELNLGLALSVLEMTVRLTLSR